MSVDTQHNSSAYMEQALTLAIRAQGEPMTTVDRMNYYGFQISDQTAFALPQVMLACAPDVPDGFRNTIRKMSCAIVCMTSVKDDADRVLVGRMYGKVRKMIAECNATQASLAAWTTAYLPSGYHLAGLVVMEGDVYFEEHMSAISITVEAELCIPTSEQ